MPDTGRSCNIARQRCPAGRHQLFRPLHESGMRRGQDAIVFGQLGSQGRAAGRFEEVFRFAGTAIQRFRASVARIDRAPSIGTMIPYFYHRGIIKLMDTRHAVDKLAALAQETRLGIFRLLVEAGNAGINAGAIAETLNLPPATLSFHVAQLTRAALIQARQESRFIYYSVNYGAMDDLIAYLAQNCCQGGSCLPKTAAVSTKAKRRRLAKVGT